MTDPGFWTLLEIGLRDDGALVAIVTRLRAVVKKAIETAPANAEHGWLDLLATDQMNRLEAEFATIMPRSLHRMASHIRAHPDQFVIGRVAER